MEASESDYANGVQSRRFKSCSKLPKRGAAVQDLTFGVFDHLDRGGRSLTDLYEQRLHIVEQYDRAGFYAYHLAEHHSTPLGLAPSPGIFLSAVARRTKVLRFGPLVYLLPLYHPLRLAEEIAMLDHLSHGRLEIGIGRGRSPIELTLYGQEVAKAQAVFDEAFTVMRLAFSEDRINFTGEHFSFHDVPVELRPLQRPHPPLWYGIGTPESAEQYGALGFRGVTLAKPAAAAEITRRFYEASTRGGYQSRRMGICRFIVVGESDREAQDLACRAYPVWHASFFELFRRYGQKPVQIWPASFEEMAANGLAFAGSPSAVADALYAQLQVVGANYLVGQFVFGDMSLAESGKSIELFASKVMPELVSA
jgi:alkanesulfonate monooxygenase SsuD/methylene tetrahydromethanopterin reductase-like flavin-dependent oxidoreductase (luciferase family)